MGKGRGTPLLLMVAGVVIVLAGMKAASDLLEPFLLAVFLSIVCAPIVTWLTRHRWPEALAVGAVVLGLIILLTGGMTLVGASVNGFIKHLPEYQQALNDRVGELLGQVGGNSAELDMQTLRERFDAGMLMGLVSDVAGGFGAALGNFMLILLTVAFILLEAARLPAKLRAAFSSEAGQGLEMFDRFAHSVKGYLAIKTLVSFGTGISVAVMLWVLNIDYPLLWGVIAFLFNYIPNIGSFLAGIPASLLAFIVHGAASALAVIGGYVVINVVFGNILEPRLMGRSLGLSPLVVLLSLVFWGWILGPVGMVLSVPLTMILRIAFEVRDDTRWLAILLGPEVRSVTDTATLPEDA